MLITISNFLEVDLSVCESDYLLWNTSLTTDGTTPKLSKEFMADSTVTMNFSVAYELWDNVQTA